MGVCKMRVTLFVLAFTVLFACAFANVAQEEGVYVLTNDNFDSWLADQEFALIEFYAPWCGHCKNLAPHYADAAQQLAAASSPVKLAKVDATEHPELGQKFEVSGYPTLFWFAKDQGYAPTPYNGPREAAGIVQWTVQQAKKALDILETDAQLKSAIEKNSPEAVIVLYGESDSYSALLALSKSVSTVHVFQITDSAQFGGHNSGEFVIYPSHKEPVVSAATAEEEVFRAVLENAYPPVVPFEGSNFQRLAAAKPFVIVAVEDLSDEEKKASLISLLNTVVETRDSFGIMYGDSAQLGRGVQGAGASGNVYPTIIAINPQSNQQIAFDEELEFTVDVVGKWLDGLLDGTTTTFRKSEPVPENNDGPVTTLVAKNFDALTAGKPALIKYYAPWCGHCKTLAPVYEELGEAFKGKNVVIAKIDATANYVAADISGFPTLIWYDGNGNSELYEDARDLQSLTNFVNQKLGTNTGAHDEL